MPPFIFSSSMFALITSAENGGWMWTCLWKLTDVNRYAENVGIMFRGRWWLDVITCKGNDGRAWIHLGEKRAGCGRVQGKWWLGLIAFVEDDGWPGDSDDRTWTRLWGNRRQEMYWGCYRLMTLVHIPQLVKTAFRRVQVFDTSIPSLSYLETENLR